MAAATSTPFGPVEAWYWRDGDTLVPALRQRVREHQAGNAKASYVQLFASCDGSRELGRWMDAATTQASRVADAGDTQLEARVFDPIPVPSCATPAWSGTKPCNWRTPPIRTRCRCRSPWRVDAIC